jgi:hypothetical protein
MVCYQAELMLWLLHCRRERARLSTLNKCFKRLNAVVSPLQGVLQQYCS